MNCINDGREANTLSLIEGLQQHIVNKMIIFFFTRENTKTFCLFSPKECSLQYFLLKINTRKHFWILKQFAICVFFRIMEK